MTYHVGYRTAARGQLSRLAPAAQEKLVAAIGRLAANPRPAGCRKLQGRPGYRIRVGEYRVVYDIHEHVITVEIIGIGHRKDVYR